VLFILGNREPVLEELDAAAHRHALQFAGSLQRDDAGAARVEMLHETLDGAAGVIKASGD
jgi:hypothetical protein